MKQKPTTKTHGVESLFCVDDSLLLTCLQTMGPGVWLIHPVTHEVRWVGKIWEEFEDGGSTTFKQKNNKSQSRSRKES